MNELVINGNTLRYAGLPLRAYCSDGMWGGRSNFCSANASEPRVDLKDLADCQKYMKEWAKDPDHKGGFILDFSTRTAYYDTEVALKRLTEHDIPRRNLENYFTQFIQQQF